MIKGTHIYDNYMLRGINPTKPIYIPEASHLKFTTRRLETGSEFVYISSIQLNQTKSHLPTYISIKTYLIIKNIGDRVYGFFTNSLTTVHYITHQQNLKSLRNITINLNSTRIVEINSMKDVDFLINILNYI